MSSVDNLCKQFGPRSGPTKFWPDLGPNCFQRLSADDTGWQRVKLILILMFLLNHVFVFFHRMKKKYYSWDECLNLREVKVIDVAIYSIIQ